MRPVLLLSLLTLLAAALGAALAGALPARQPGGVVSTPAVVSETDVIPPRRERQRERERLAVAQEEREIEDASTPAAMHPGVRVDALVVDGETGAPMDVPVRAAFEGRTAGRPGRVILDIDPPPGWMPAAGFAARRVGDLRPGSHTVRATFVLLPAVRVTLVPDVRFRGRVRKASLSLEKHGLDGAGRRAVRFLVPRHADVRLRGTIETAQERGDVTYVLSPTDDRVALAVPYPTPDEGSVGVTCRGAPGIPSIAWSGDASLTVRVFDRRGRPAGHARVELEARTADDDVVYRRGKTGADGVVEFDGIARSSGTLVVVPREGTPSIVDVRVEGGSETQVRVDEPPPSRVSVTVVDRRGRPVCGALLSPWFDDETVRLAEDDGVRRLNLVTDVNGRCVVTGAPPRGFAVQARWGGMSAWAEETAPGVLTAVLPFPR